MKLACVSLQEHQEIIYKNELVVGRQKKGVLMTSFFPYFLELKEIAKRFT
jgi:hypothetical protein